jgi:hypothetical protein
MGDITMAIDDQILDDPEPVLEGEEDLDMDEPPPPDPGSEFVAEAGTADIGMPDEDATDDLVGSDADAAELAALAASNGHAAAHADDMHEIEARLEQLERAQREVVAAARKRDAARVRRKVVASTSGAAAAGLVPILLQLVNALHVSPEVAATVASAVASLGALVAGYLTPERAPALPPGAVDVVPPPQV